MENYLIDVNGKPYIKGISYPCGGGLDKRCSYNDIALECYYKKGNKEDISKYLKEKGFGNPIHDDNHISIWEKGDTKIYFEEYIDGLYGYLTTEYIG